MAPVEVFRYTDSRGDKIIYKFDAALAKSPSSATASDAITVFHEFRLDFPAKYQLHSHLWEKDVANERWRKDRQPPERFLLHRGTDAQGRTLAYRFMPFHSNGNRFFVEVEAKAGGVRLQH